MTANPENHTTKLGLPDRAFSVEKNDSSCSDRFKPHDWKRHTEDGITKPVYNTEFILKRTARLLANPEYAALIDAYVSVIEERDQLRAQLDKTKTPVI